MPKKNNTRDSETRTEVEAVSDVPGEAGPQVDWTDYDENDPFLNLFDSPDVYKVELYRLEPQFVNGVDITGFLGLVNPGEDFNQLKTRYGGGRYKLVKRTTEGKFSQQTTFKISGSPCLRPELQIEPSGPGGPGKNVEIGGVSFDISQDDQRFFDQAKRVLLLKTLLTEKPQPDINQVLLQHALGGKDEKGALETITEIKSAADMLGLSAGGGGETNVLDLVNQALKTLSALVVKSPAGGGGAAQIAAPGRINPGLLTENSTVEADNNNDKSQGGGEMALNTQALVNMSVSVIIQGFRLDPPKDPARVVKILDMQLNLDKKQREALVGYRDTLYDLAEMQLADDFQDDPELRGKFKTYYNSVFDQYIDEKREVAL